MTQLINSLEALCLPLKEEAALLVAIASEPVRKLTTAVFTHYQSKRYWSSCLCLMTAAGYLLLNTAFIWCFAPAIKTVILAKFAVSPFTATCISAAIKYAYSWGLGKIAFTVNRKIASLTGSKS